MYILALTIHSETNTTNTASAIENIECAPSGSIWKDLQWESRPNEDQMTKANTE